MPMTILTIVLFAVALLSTIAALFLKKRESPDLKHPWPFYAKKLLSEPEQVLYYRMVKAMPECMVLAQVQLSRILGVKKGFNFSEWHNRINRMSVDFLVCLKDSSIVAAIELDDESQKSWSRREADAKKQKSLESAGITLIRWQVSSLPDEAAIRAAFTK